MKQTPDWRINLTLASVFKENKGIKTISLNELRRHYIDATKNVSHVSFNDFLNKLLVFRITDKIDYENKKITFKDGIE